MGPAFLPPVAGDRILVVKEPFLRKLLDGSKTLEVRPFKLAAPRYYLGCKALIYAEIRFGAAELIGDTEAWTALASRHCLSTTELPYKRTFAHPVLTLKVPHAPLPYVHPRGAIGLVRCR